jgi:hypothetical protein
MIRLFRITGVGAGSPANAEYNSDFWRDEGVERGHWVGEKATVD